MTSQYEKRGKVIEFKAGDYYIIKVPKKDRSSDTAIIRILVRVLRRYGYIYEL
jgi:hypothetical protein